MAKIMVVDENKNLRFLYKLELSHEGHEVITVSSNEAAIKKLDQTSVDIIVSELQQPNGNGFKNFKQFYEKNGNLKVIINTAYQSEPYQKWQGHVDAYLTKSSDVSILKKIIQEVLY